MAQLPCQAVEGNKCSQNLIVSSCELVSPPSHLIPTFASCECHFNAAFLNFITSRLSTASETAFRTVSGLFCRAGRKNSLLFFPQSHWLPMTPTMVVEVAPVSGLGLLPAGCGWVVLRLSGWHRQAAVSKASVWSSRASSWPWTNLQLGCNPA